MSDSHDILTVSEGKKPFWQLIIAGILYTAAAYILCLMIYYFSIQWIYVGIKMIQLLVLVVLIAMKFSVTTTKCIDFKKEKLRTIYSLGIFSSRYLSEIPNLEYVSVFWNDDQEHFEVNLWYNTNRRFNLGCFEQLKPAYDFGMEVCKKVKVDFFDATQKGDFKRISKESFI